MWKHERHLGFKILSRTTAQSVLRSAYVLRSISGRDKDISPFYSVQIGLGVHSVSYQTTIIGSSLGVKRQERETDNSLSSNAVFRRTHSRSVSSSAETNLPVYLVLECGCREGIGGELSSR
jgi:hypothetical protein